jgi:hypothetical protein
MTWLGAGLGVLENLGQGVYQNPTPNRQSRRKKEWGHN